MSVSKFPQEKNDLLHYYQLISHKELQNKVGIFVNETVETTLHSLSKLVRFMYTIDNYCVNDFKVLKSNHGLENIEQELSCILLEKSSKQKNEIQDSINGCYKFLQERLKNGYTPFQSKCLESLSFNGEAFQEEFSPITAQNDLVQTNFDILNVIHCFKNASPTKENKSNSSNSTLNFGKQLFVDCSKRTSSTYRTSISSFESPKYDYGEKGLAIGKDGTPVKFNPDQAKIFNDLDPCEAAVLTFGARQYSNNKKESPFIEASKSFNIKEGNIDTYDQNKSIKMLSSKELKSANKKTSGFMMNGIKTPTFLHNEKGDNFVEILHPNGRLYYRGTTLNKLFHGKGEMYHPNGNLEYRGDFMFGGPHGKRCTQYWENEKVKYIGEMINGKKHGDGIFYDEKGILNSEGFYLNGKLHGSQCCIYHETGEIMYQGLMKNGLYEGNNQILYPTGQVQLKGNFFKGKLEGKGEEYHENGQLKYRGNFKESMYEVQGEIYHPNGVQYFHGSLHKNEPHGENCKLYYSNSKINYEGGMLHGSFNGYGKKYDRKGILRYAGYYSDGQKEGKKNCKEYNQNGTLEYQGGFEKGYYQNYGILYNSSNNIIYKGVFNNGKYGDGFGELYYESNYQTGFNSNSICYNGIFKDGYANGFGKLYWRTGKYQANTSFINGMINDSVKIFSEEGYIVYEGKVEMGMLLMTGNFYDKLGDEITSQKEKIEIIEFYSDKVTVHELVALV